ncbi:MAG: hypothetical protein QOD75_2731 [Blastocatellia bacterium]|jgi:hypothetical protein|nr:hypothetical protein [Blastocatellia bacterium]
MKRSELVANIAVGGFGAFGQGALLAHTLDSYPFAILMSPPERFYSSAGWALAFIAPLLSLVLLFLFRSTLRPFVTAIPVAACPLVYWLLFRLVFLLSGYHYAPIGKGSDLVATKSIENGFSSLVVSLTFAGLVAGVICGLAMWLLFKNIRSHGVA